jgi:glutamine synthetase
MPKPIHGINGSGMHTHQSLFSIAESKNSFADPDSAYGLSDLARSYMAGILAHARGMIAVLAPTVNSYKRLVPGYEAPTYLTWGRTNRSALIRVPKVSPGKSIEGTRVEVRCPDPSSNTYLAFAAMIAAGLDGVEQNLQLGEPVEESLFEMTADRIAEKGIRELPGTLGEALDELEDDDVIRSALGEHVYSHFAEAKRAEWDAYRTSVSQWELDTYLEAF